MARKTLIIAAALALAGCINQSSIQSKYAEQQDKCREEVSRTASATNQTTSSPEGRAAIGMQFGECMNKAGWRVAMPKTGTPVVQNPPTGSPSTNPSAATAVVAAPIAAQNPPAGAPSTNPSAAVSGTQTGPAQYHPAPGRPTTQAPAYGSGGGRNF